MRIYSIQGIVGNKQLLQYPHQQRREMNMTSVIEELYLGNVRPGSDLALRNPSFSKVMEREEHLSQELMNTLNSNSKELFERFCDSRAELDEVTQYDIFTYALKFGIMLMVEVFSGDTFSRDGKIADK